MGGSVEPASWRRLIFWRWRTLIARDLVTTRTSGISLTKGVYRFANASQIVGERHDGKKA